MGSRLGNLNDLKHSCPRHGLRDVLSASVDLGDVEACSECGTVWFVFPGVLGRRWKRLKGWRLRRWERGGTDGLG